MAGVRPSQRSQSTSCSLGSEQLIRPGELNLMTAGRAISHSEETPREHSPTLHGVQLWVALPDCHRGVEPRFDHHSDLPLLTDTGGSVRVLMGEMGGVRAPARTYSPLVGAEVLACCTDGEIISGG